jgi:hypothetical protein
MRTSFPAIIAHTIAPRSRWLISFGALAVLATAAVATLAGCGPASSVTAAAAAPQTTQHLTFDILPAKPGGPATNFPAYMATSPTALPANTLVTVTIRNFDLGDDSLPANSPFLHVQGVTGAATMDGKAFTSLDAKHIAHTFTIAQLHLNVPISGDPVGDANYVSVSFSFKTPATPGTYTFQCYIPCGTGASGWNGPMATMGFMRGTITVA